MSEDEVSSESTDNTSVVGESESQSESSGAETQESASEKNQDEKVGFNDPRHPDHARFKELYDTQKEYKAKFEESARERETYRQSIEAMQRELQALRQQAIPKKEEPKDQFLADLEKVNPAYAKSLQAVYERANKTEELEQRIARYETQQFQEKALGRFNELLTTNKVTNPVDQRIYRAAIRETVTDLESSGKRLGLKDLETIFNTFHGDYVKAMEERERAITAKYVADKKSDKTPKGTTGGGAIAPTAKKIPAGDVAGQAKWLADQIRSMKKEH